jgi:hypothetical protein
MATEVLDGAEINALVADWYRKLDIHAPFEELVPLVAEEGLAMYWPEGPTFGIAGFREWYERVTRTFFDEVHSLKEVTISPRGEQADVSVVVNWQAKVWNPPEPTSKWLGMDAFQSWVVSRSPATGRIVIQKYVVDRLELMEGSSSL